MPRSSVRKTTQPSQPFKSELRHGPKGKVYMSIAPIGRRDGRTRQGLREQIPQLAGQNRLRLLSLSSQNKVNAVLAQRKKEAYENLSSGSKRVFDQMNIPGHASRIHGPPEETAHTSAATLSTVPRPDAVLSTTSPSTVPDMSPLPTLTPHHSRIRLADEPSLHDMPQATTTIKSSHLTPPVNLENNQAPAISLKSATAAATQCPAESPTPHKYL